MSKLTQELKEFVVKDNAAGMAVGVIIGDAFGEIVSSIADGIIMPPIGWFIGSVNFLDLKWTLPAVEIPGVTAPALITINYDNFLQTLLDFIIIAFYVFMMVKGINKLSKKEEGEPVAPAPDSEPANEEKLPSEIRDLLKNK